MLITFTSKVYPDVVMFGDVAIPLLRAMGQGDQPPGILRGEDIRTATERLRAWLDQAALREKTVTPAEEDRKSDEERKELRNRVGLRTRAVPLLELMDESYAKEADVIWR
jgi:hypothetical protein